jgi:hypothetical protein
MIMLDALGMTQCPLALQGAFELEEGSLIFSGYKKFFKSLMKWAEVSLSSELFAICNSLSWSVNSDTFSSPHNIR